MKFIDLFSGIGGFRIPLEKLGFRCAFSSEIDKYARKTYKANFGDEPSGDITKIEANDIPDHNLLCAGFPCQSFSVSGNRQGLKDTRGNLFFEIKRILKEKKPKYFILENVPALLSTNRGKDFQLIYKNLADIGYKIKYDILNSKNFGVPQDRKRLFIVGFSNEEDWFKFQFPEGELTSKRLSDVLEDIYRDSNLFLSDKALEGIFNRKVTQIKDEPDKLFGTITIKTSCNGRQVIRINKGYYPQGQRIYDKKGLSVTISSQGGGQGAKTGLYHIGEGIRRLSVRECARLQGFPDSFEFPVSDSQAYKQIGNSVTTNVIYEIGKNLYTNPVLKA